MKHLLTIFLFCLALNTLAQTTIRVRSTDNLQTIINNATAGSTLIVEAGNYGDITVNKRLNFTGPGYFLTTGSQATLGAAVLGNVTLNAGSDNTNMTGMYITANLNINTSQNIIRKCFIEDLYLGQYSGVVGNSNIIQNCYINDYFSITNNLNFVFKGNLFFRVDISGSSQITGQIINNTIRYIPNTSYSGRFDVSVSSSSSIIVKNNILYSMTGSLINVSIDYNTFISTISGLNNTNKQNIPLNSLFVSSSAGYDSAYQLSTTSPAKGAGENGVDCGAFGGDEPYVLSGLPSGPIVYELSVPSQVTPPSTLNIRVRARVQN
jgi:hypothetical protein